MFHCHLWWLVSSCLVYFSYFLPTFLYVTWHNNTQRMFHCNIYLFYFFNKYFVIHYFICEVCGLTFIFVLLVTLFIFIIGDIVVTTYICVIYWVLIVSLFFTYNFPEIVVLGLTIINSVFISLYIFPYLCHKYYGLFPCLIQALQVPYYYTLAYNDLYNSLGSFIYVYVFILFHFPIYLHKSYQ